MKIKRVMMDLKAIDIPALSTREVFEKSGKLKQYDALREFGFDSDLFLRLPIGCNELFFVTVRAHSKHDVIGALSTTMERYSNFNIYADTVDDFILQIMQHYSDISRDC